MAMEMEMEAAVAVTTGVTEVVEMAETVKEVTESGTDWEVEQIKGTDDDGRAGNGSDCRKYLI
jgi:hypothetical protein